MKLSRTLSTPCFYARFFPVFFFISSSHFFLARVYVRVAFFFPSADGFGLFICLRFVRFVLARWFQMLSFVCTSAIQLKWKPLLANSWNYLMNLYILYIFSCILFYRCLHSMLCALYIIPLPVVVDATAISLPFTFLTCIFVIDETFCDFT